jgi:hypothetical protein
MKFLGFYVAFNIAWVAFVFVVLGAAAVVGYLLDGFQP